MEYLNIFERTVMKERMTRLAKKVKERPDKIKENWGDGPQTILSTLLLKNCEKFGVEEID